MQKRLFSAMPHTPAQSDKNSAVRSPLPAFFLFPVRPSPKYPQTLRHSQSALPAKHARAFETALRFRPIPIPHDTKLPHVQDTHPRLTDEPHDSYTLSGSQRGQTAHYFRLRKNAADNPGPEKSGKRHAAQNG